MKTTLIKERAAELEAERREGDVDVQVFKVKKPKGKKKPVRKPRKGKSVA